VTPQAVVALEQYAWPGNVRELETVLEQAMVFQSGGSVESEDLGLPALVSGKEPDGRRPPRGGRSAVDTESLTWSQREALRIASARGDVRRSDLTGRCGISRESARQDLIALVARGLLRRVGRGRGVRYIPRRTANVCSPIRVASWWTRCRTTLWRNTGRTGAAALTALTSPAAIFSATLRGARRRA
jgi:hypothetical protein